MCVAELAVRLALLLGLLATIGLLMAIVALQCSKLLAARSSEQQKARELADATTELQRLERARSVRERSKASQSQVTYRWDYAAPRFMPLAEHLQG